MLASTGLIAALSALAVQVSASPLQPRANSSVLACQQIASQFSSASKVAYLLDPDYALGIAHYSPTNVQFPACVVYPGTAQDVAVVIKTVGPARVPFGVKGGGHSFNKGFSSSNGVLIAMKRFNQVIYDQASNTVQIGTGNVWDDVYAGLEGKNVGVLGGRVPGVGVAGFTLGGGYSWRTNQYGLTIDTATQYELVTPQGNIVNITEASNSDIFFGLRGGLNNFGVVTRFWLTAHPAPSMVWGGPQIYSGLDYDKVFGACSSFDLYNTDKKASILCDYINSAGIVTVIVIAFYDGPTPPTPSPFANFTTGVTPLIPGWKTRTMTEHTKSIPADALAGQRGWYHSASVREITPGIIKAVKTLGQKYSPGATLNGGSTININLEPFVPGFFSYSKGGAYPHSSANELKPIEINLVWNNPLADNYFAKLSRQIENDLLAAARADGQDLPDPIIYSNYALADTPLPHMFGQNVDRLKQIRASWDPQGVMTLAGGFKFV